MNPFLIFPRPLTIPLRPSCIHARLDDIAELASRGSWDFLFGLGANGFESLAMAKLAGIPTNRHDRSHARILPRIGPPDWRSTTFVCEHRAFLRSDRNDWVEIRLKGWALVSIATSTRRRRLSTWWTSAFSSELADDLDDVHDLSDWEAADETIQSKLSRLASSTIKSLAL